MGEAISKERCFVSKSRLRSRQTQGFTNKRPVSASSTPVSHGPHPHLPSSGKAIPVGRTALCPIEAHRPPHPTVRAPRGPQSQQTPPRLTEQRCRLTGGDVQNSGEPRQDSNATRRCTPSPQPPTLQAGGLGRGSNQTTRRFPQCSPFCRPAGTSVAESKASPAVRNHPLLVTRPLT